VLILLPAVFSLAKPYRRHSKIFATQNKNPTALAERVGHLSFDSCISNLSLRSCPRCAVATAAAGTDR